MARLDRRRNGESGGATLEFLFCCLLLAPLLLGTTGVGLALIREIQVQQVSRDSAHMYANGIDFSSAEPANRALLVRIASNLGITETSPQKAIILTTVNYITELDCKAAGYSSGCTNQDNFVITRRVVIGDATNVRSVLGDPVAPDSGGNVRQSVYLTNPADRVASFPAPISTLWEDQWANEQQNGQLAYVSEVIVTSNDLAWTGFAGDYTSAISFF